MNSSTRHISEKALLVRLSISQWTARRHDKKISDEVAEQHNAQADAGRYNKMLIEKTALQPIQTIADAARQFLAKNSLPWLDDGYRVLPSANYEAGTTRLRAIRLEYDAAVTKFLAGYPEQIERARVRLNGMFDIDDYPNEREIRRSFGFSLDAMPMPDKDDFRVNLSEMERDRIKAEIDQRVSDAIDGAVGDLWRRIHEVVSRMAERLAAYKVNSEGKAEGIFRDTLVTNIRDLVELLPRLNMTNDARLAAMVDRMRDQLCAFEPQELREDPKARETTRASAEQILADMAGYIS